VAAGGSARRCTPFSRGIAPAVYHRNNFMRQKAPSRRPSAWRKVEYRAIHQPSVCGRSKDFFNSFLTLSSIRSARLKGFFSICQSGSTGFALCVRRIIFNTEIKSISFFYIPLRSRELDKVRKWSRSEGDIKSKILSFGFFRAKMQIAKVCSEGCVVLVDWFLLNYLSTLRRIWTCQATTHWATFMNSQRVACV
jgi:hypothetical protein